jgi:L-amino acid N-acyltransferase YncA
MSPLVRPAAPEDAESLAVLSQGLYRPENAATWRKAAQEQAGSGFLIVAIELEAGQVSGYGYARPDLPGRPDAATFRLHIGVQQDARRKGIGARLYEALLPALRAGGATTLRARAPGTDVDSLGFLAQRGFFEYQRMCHLAQDLTGLQIPLLTAPDGICISTLAEELERRPDCLPVVHALQNECFRDVPSADPFHPLSYEAFSRILQDPLMLPA